MAASDVQNTSSPVEQPSDFGSRPEDLIAYWLAQDKIAEKGERKWIRQARKIVKRYRDERPSSVNSDLHRYNILWSNVQTLEPAVYARVPKPDVERRFKDQDQVGRLASMILERAISWSLDSCDFDLSMKASVKDYLLGGRGVMRVIYCPYYGDPIKDEGEDGGAEQTEKWGASAVVANDGDEGKDNPLDTDATPQSQPQQESLREVVDEEVKLHYVFWEDYREGPARQWGEVPWIRYRAYMNRDELTDRFGPKGKRVSLDAPIGGESANSNPSRLAEDKATPLFSVLKEAEIWEIWDKTKKRVLWVAPGSPELGLLDEVDDPLGLPDFFPSPNPLLSTTTNETRIPVPDFIEYQDQAAEMDILTARIDRLLKALKVSGVYAGAEKQVLQQLVDEGTENKLIPVEDWQSFAGDKGGLQNLIMWMPIQQVAETVLQLYAARDRTKQVLYEVTGMSDIIRGVTNPAETATAQQIKAQFGTLRLNDRQRIVARFARDAIRLTGYVIAGQFSPQTISRMTGYPHLMPVPPPPQGPQMVIDGQTGQLTPSPQMLQYQQQFGPVIMQNQMAQQQFEAACKLLKEDMYTGFKIDIESDSTILPDEQADKQSRIEFMGALVPFMSQVLPIAQGNPAFMGLAKDMTLFLVRGFRAGRELEESVEKAFDQLGQMPPQQKPGEGGQAQPDPAEGQAKLMAAQSDAQTKQAQTQITAQKAQADTQIAGQTLQSNTQTKLAAIQVQREKNQQDFALGQQRNQIDADFKAQDLALRTRKQEGEETIDAATLLQKQQQGARTLD